MTLRTEIEALLEEFDHFAYRGAPLDVAVEKLQEILDNTKPRVLTTVEELDSEEASKALGLNACDGSGLFGFYGRTTDGRNEWSGMGTTDFYTASELIARYGNLGDEARFTLVHDSDGSLAPAVAPAPPALTTEAELNSEEAFNALCIVSSGSLPRTPASRSDGVTYWHKPCDAVEYNSADLLASFTETGVTPVFTMVECSFPPVGRRVLTTEDELNSVEAFYALCIVPYGGPLRVAITRRGDVNYWREPGYGGEYSSAELLEHFASIGAEPAFTLIER